MCFFFWLIISFVTYKSSVSFTGPEYSRNYNLRFYVHERNQNNNKLRVERKQQLSKNLSFLFLEQLGLLSTAFSANSYSSETDRSQMLRRRNLNRIHDFIQENLTLVFYPLFLSFLPSSANLSLLSPNSSNNFLSPTPRLVILFILIIISTLLLSSFSYSKSFNSSLSRLKGQTHSWYIGNGRRPIRYKPPSSQESEKVKGRRAKGIMVVLVRNSELNDIVLSLRSVEGRLSSFFPSLSFIYILFSHPLRELMYLSNHRKIQ